MNPGLASPRLVVPRAPVAISHADNISRQARRLPATREAVSRAWVGGSQQAGRVRHLGRFHALDVGAGGGRACCGAFWAAGLASRLAHVGRGAGGTGWVGESMSGQTDGSMARWRQPWMAGALAHGGGGGDGRSPCLRTPGHLKRMHLRGPTQAGGPYQAHQAPPSKPQARRDGGDATAQPNSVVCLGARSTDLGVVGARVAPGGVPPEPGGLGGICATEQWNTTLSSPQALGPPACPDAGALLNAPSSVGGAQLTFGNVLQQAPDQTGFRGCQPRTGCMVNEPGLQHATRTRSRPPPVGADLRRVVEACANPIPPQGPAPGSISPPAGRRRTVQVTLASTPPDARCKPPPRIHEVTARGATPAHCTSYLWEAAAPCLLVPAAQCTFFPFLPCTAGRFTLCLLPSTIHSRGASSSRFFCHFAPASLFARSTAASATNLESARAAPATPTSPAYSVILALHSHAAAHQPRQTAPIGSEQTPLPSGAARVGDPVRLHLCSRRPSRPRLVSRFFASLRVRLPAPSVVSFTRAAASRSAAAHSADLA
ncbi:hypothetical protein Purlil1_836 [Purpureocillium lilacinum]|uniref:Uncharacterized protein n=1 Tax=Purpureocillium lilacinum TaxID=33203 RepID=A0ABR0CFP9_PURLI|nr:hypothetical protein Purlil1_836 [Purpureocillium lilacinum]